MALLNQSVQVYGQIKDLLEALQQGQAPEKFTHAFLKDIGFTSSNFRAFIPLLKGLGFLTSDGAPTQRYRNFLDKTQSWKELAGAVKEAYTDIFILKSRPTKNDRALIEGKYKSTYNLSDVQANRAAHTFLALLDLSDQKTLYATETGPSKVSQAEVGSSQADQPEGRSSDPQDGQVITYGQRRIGGGEGIGLHYNIQIHLPATKDLEVYNAIFKSIREHLID
jgi:hypothetical protein